MGGAGMPVDVRNQKPRRRWWRRTHRWLIAILPTVVWVLAIAVAYQLHHRVGVTSTVAGFAADRPVTLAHLEPGTVQKVHVRLYEEVARGRALVTMDDRQERIRLAAIEKEIERLRTEVAAERARVAADNARATADYVDLARRFAVDRETAHLDYLSQLTVDARERILLRGALVEYDVVRSLYEGGNAPFRELNDIETEVDALKASVAKNAEVLERKKQVFERADRRWVEYVERDGLEIPFEPVLTPLRLAVEAGEHDLEQLVFQIDNHVLRSPIDGQVTLLAARAGDRVQAGVPLVAVSPTLTNEVVAYLPDRMVASAGVGAPVSVHCLAPADDRRRECTGTVVSLSATVTEAPPRHRVLPNYPVWGRGLVVALNDGVRLIPGEAVHIAFLDRQ